MVCGGSSLIMTRHGLKVRARDVHVCHDHGGEKWLARCEYLWSPARRAWIAVVGNVDQNNDVTSVCEGTNKQNDLNYYLQRKRRTGDFHGQAPVLWAASALLR